MMHDGHLSIGLLNLQPRGGGLNVQEVIVGGIHDHLGYLCDVLVVREEEEETVWV